MYLVTELVEGEDLAERVKRKGPLPPLEAMHFIWQAAKGLRYAHSQGIVHRDIKPSNLLLNRKKVVKVLDLGLARLQASNAGVKANDPTLTHAGHFVGTVAFMAPEQARSAVLADERSDIYGLGCTLYYTLAGKVPFRGETDLDTILAHLEQPIPNLPQASGPERIPFPTGLSALLQRMLAKAPVDRPQSMQAVVDDLSSLIKQEQRRAEQGFDEIHSGSTPRSNSETGSRPQRRKQNFQALLQPRTVWITMATSLLLALIVVRQFWPFNNPSRNDPSFLENLGRAASSQEAQGNLPPPADLNSNQNQAVAGIRFDGRNDYLAVDHFDLPLPPQIRVEMAVMVDELQGPANLLTWSGPRSFVFFVSERRWGVAYFDGHQPQLMVSSQNIRPGQLQLVAGEWDGQQLRIFVDGQPVAIQEIQYALHPSSIGLYLGGVPDGILPAEQGPRYLGGSLTAVRISNETNSRPAQSIAELHTVSPSSVALFRFTEGAGETTSDQSQHRWQARFHGAAWNR